MNLEKIMLFAILTALFIYSIVFADGGVYWQDNGILVCDSTFGGGLQPIDMIPDGFGGAIIVWEDGRTLFGIACQRIDSLGNIMWDSEGVFIDSNASLSPYPCIVSDGSGGAIISWVHDDILIRNVYVQKVRYDGIPVWGYPGIQVAISDSAQVYSKIVSDGSGGYIIAWLDKRNGDYDVYAQRVDSSGARLWGDMGIPICSEGSTQGFLQIDRFGNNDAVIVWSDMRNGDWDVYGQRIDSNGTPLWDYNGKIIYSDSGDQYLRDIVNDTRNGVILVWEEGSYSTYDFDIYGQKIDSNGVVCWGANGIVICDEDSLEIHPKIESDGKGGIIVAWLDERTSFRWDVYVQRVDSDGICLWDSNGIFVSTIADTSQEATTLHPQICSDNRSGAIVTWKDYRNDNWDVYCQRVDSLAILQWGAGGLPVCTTPDRQDWGPVICGDSKNGGIIAWGDKRYYASVFAQRVGDVVGVVQRRGHSQNQEAAQFVCHPNPFTDMIYIRITMPKYAKFKPGEFSIGIYDIAGRLVRILCNEKKQAGVYSVRWSGFDNNNRKVPAGVYFTRLVAGDFTSVKKIILIR